MRRIPLTLNEKSVDTKNFNKEYGEKERLKEWKLIQKWKRINDKFPDLLTKLTLFPFWGEIYVPINRYRIIFIQFHHTNKENV